MRGAVGYAASLLGWHSIPHRYFSVMLGCAMDERLLCGRSPARLRSVVLSRACANLLGRVMKCLDPFPVWSFW